MDETLLPQMLFFGAVGLILFLALQRWFLAIDARIKYQKAMIAFLIKLCKQQGVSADEIDEMKKLFGLK